MEENKSPDFTLHGNDVCAPAAVNAYADALEQHNADASLVTDARNTANEMLRFQQENGGIIPQPAPKEQAPAEQQQPAQDQQPPAGEQQQSNDGGQTSQNHQAGAEGSDNSNANNSNTGEAQPQAFDLNEFNAEIAEGKITVSKKAS